MIADVIPNKRLPRGIGDTFSYQVPEELENGLRPGQLVRVDFRGRTISALVKAVRPQTEDKNLKPVIKLLADLPVVTPRQMRLAVWLANYYFTSLATATKLVIPDIPKKNIKFHAAGIKQNIKTNSKPQTRLIWWDDNEIKDQETEEAVKQAIKDGRQVLHLFPEFYQAVEAKNQGGMGTGKQKILLWQNSPGKKKNLEQWLKVLNSEANLILGTRSALFAPYKNLGLIIVEDEADNLYKSEITPRYHARTVARQLSLLHGARLLIASPAPSFESYTYFKAPPPEQTSGQIKIIDIREERKKENYSSLAEEVQRAITDSLSGRKKIFIYHNRRGHSTSAICQDCGLTFLCPDCHLPLRYHASLNILVCHHCRFRQELPPFCPKCGRPNLKLAGRGTEKIEQEVKKLFPKAKLLRLDSDVKNGASYKLPVTDYDIIIGTEFAFSGARINWSDISLIVALNADTALYRPDYRASERSYQQIIALQHLNPGAKVYVQTYNPDSNDIRAITNNQPETFYEEELKIRQALGYPPYCDLIKLIYRSPNEKKAVGEAMHIYNRLQKHLIKETKKKYPLEILRPFPAFERKERGRFKFHLILKIGGDAPEELYEKIRELVPPDWVFDRDPETLL